MQLSRDRLNLRWVRVRSSLTRPSSWKPATPPPEPDSYRALWFKLTHQPQETAVTMDPFAEPVSLVLPV